MDINLWTVWTYVLSFPHWNSEIKNLWLIATTSSGGSKRNNESKNYWPKSTGIVFTTCNFKRILPRFNKLLKDGSKHKFVIFLKCSGKWSYLGQLRKKKKIFKMYNNEKINYLYYTQSKLNCPKIKGILLSD